MFDTRRSLFISAGNSCQGGGATKQTRIMKSKIYLLILSGFLLAAFSLRAEDKPKSREEVIKILKSLKYQQGEIKLRGGLATLNVPTNFAYLSPDDAQKVLVKLWGNPPNSKNLGMLMPAGKTPLDDDRWAVTISFTEDGYVKDDDAGKINYDDLLKTMRKDTREASAEREKQGYHSVELIGWAAPPHYDAETHKMYWAKELKFGNQTEDTLNYNIRMLGRRGVLVLNGIGSMDQLPELEKASPDILAMVNFNDGNRYADFDPKVDKVATYGLAALVAGGIAAKLGLFKLVWVFILAAKKFIIIGCVAIGAWFKKTFGKKLGPTVT
jgi:uncharacterized membrane-anchored protein